MDLPASPSDRPSSAAGPGAVVAPATTAPADLRAPATSVRLLSGVRQAALTGRVRVAVRTDEAGVVALAAAVRPGPRAARRARSPQKHWRGVIHTAYRSKTTVPR